MMMIKYDPKHYDKAFQAPAGRWWSTLSINEMKALEKQYGTIGRATPQEVAAIYEAEVLVAGRTGCFTKKLNSGRVVLAKLYKGELSAVGYANRTQAQNKVDMLTAVGIKCSVVGHTPSTLRSLVFSIRYRKNGRWRFVRLHGSGPVRIFAKRVQAKQFLRNHYYDESEIVPCSLKDSTTTST